MHYRNGYRCYWNGRDESNGYGSQKQVWRGHEHVWWGLSTLLGATHGYLFLISVFQRAACSQGRPLVVQTRLRPARRVEFRWGMYSAHRSKPYSLISFTRKSSLCLIFQSILNLKGTYVLNYHSPNAAVSRKTGKINVVPLVPLSFTWRIELVCPLVPFVG